MIKWGIDMEIIGVLWYLLAVVQTLLSIGTAYRLTKNGGDNGIALWGWMLLLNICSMVPGLGIYLWFKYKED